MFRSFAIAVASSQSAGGGGGTPAIPAPTYDPPGGEFFNHPGALSVTITTAKAGSTIRYTTDGVTMPTVSVGTLISGVSGTASLPGNTFTILKSVTIFGGVASSVRSDSYDVHSGS